MLRGVRLWGVPIPNAWLGGLKDVDVVPRFGDQGGLWQAFAESIDINFMVVKSTSEHASSCAYSHIYRIRSFQPFS